MGAKKNSKLLKGHLTKEEKEKRELEEKFAENLSGEDLKKRPDWLVNDVAKNEWDRLTLRMSEQSMLCDLDFNNLGAYCNAFAKWTEVTRKLGTKLQVGKVANPLVKLELSYSDEMKKYAIMLGLSYEAKLKNMQKLAEEQQSGIESEFGDI